MKNPRPLQRYLELIETVNSHLYPAEHDVLVRTVFAHFRGLDGDGPGVSYPLADCHGPHGRGCLGDIQDIADNHESPVLREYARGLLHYKDYKPHGWETTR